MSTTDEDVKGILDEYEADKKLFEDCTKTCEKVLRRLLEEGAIEFHSVVGRTKDKEKLEEKLRRPDKNYVKLSEVTDIVGIRVITHFEDEIDRICSIVEREFEVDWANSVDKRKSLAADRFGYLSVHYICSFSAIRLGLTEYQRFQERKFEIQIRSILQHAWAEMEHDLGYKSRSELAPSTRRRFSRLAGLLEVADQEFTALRASIVETDPAHVGIDNISLKTICVRNALIRDIDAQLASGVKLPIEEDNNDILSLLSRGLRSIGINTVGQLLDGLEKQRDLLVYEATERLSGQKVRSLKRGISVLQLLWVLMGLQGGEERILAGIAELGREVNQESRKHAREVMQRIREFQRRASRGRGNSTS